MCDINVNKFEFWLNILYVSFMNYFCSKTLVMNSEQIAQNKLLYTTKLARFYTVVVFWKIRQICIHLNL